jgi:hypothetical protein
MSIKFFCFLLILFYFDYLRYFFYVVCGFWLSNLLYCLDLYFNYFNHFTFCYYFYFNCYWSSFYFWAGSYLEGCSFKINWVRVSKFVSSLARFSLNNTWNSFFFFAYLPITINGLFSVEILNYLLRNELKMEDWSYRGSNKQLKPKCGNIIFILLFLDVILNIYSLHILTYPTICSVFFLSFIIESVSYITEFLSTSLISSREVAYVKSSLILFRLVCLIAFPIFISWNPSTTS